MAEAADVQLVGTSAALDSAAVFALLASPSAVEWRHKVGVAGSRDGSGKSSTRLLQVDGWVLKTDIGRGADSREQVEGALRAMRARGLPCGIWHASKTWAIVRSGSRYYPLTVCAELSSVRSIERGHDKRLAWLEMLRLALHVSAGTGLGLDLNPANFGREGASGRLYYIDDEFYDELTPLLFAQAAAARIPEEPSFSVDDWRSFGLELGRLTTNEPGLDVALEELARALQSYPVSELFGPAREALVAGCLAAAQPTRKSRPARGARRLLGVLADVHANLPALRATLAAARQAGAERFLILGDVVGYGPHPSECIDVLASLDDTVIIRGNHDQAVGGHCPEVTMNGLARSCAEWTAARLSSVERDWLAQLPLDHREGSWLAVHGAPQDVRRLSAYVYELTYEDNLEWLCRHRIHAALHGHTHSQTVYAALATGPRRLRLDEPLRLLGRAFLLNPGSVGQPRDQDARAAFALFDPDHGTWQPLRVPYPLEQTIRDIEARGLPMEAARRLRAGR